MGEVLRRLVSKCLAAHTRQTAVSILSPLQLGVGVKGGCEAIVHAVEQVLSPSPVNDRWTLLLDFRMYSIPSAVQGVPPQAPWPLSVDGSMLLSSTSLPLFGDHSIKSCCGVQQGDPLGPLGFANLW